MHSPAKNVLGKYFTKNEGILPREIQYQSGRKILTERKSKSLFSDYSQRQICKSKAVDYSISQVKQQIQKLRTESPQFHKLTGLQERSRSCLLDKTKQNKKLQYKKSVQLYTKLSCLRQPKIQSKLCKYNLPQLFVCTNYNNLPARSNYQAQLNQAEPSESFPINSIVILKREMRHRLSKLPNFLPETTQYHNPGSFHINISGWQKGVPEHEQYQQYLQLV